MNERLFGFIGEVSGNEGSLIGMDAVSKEGERYLRYPVAEGKAPVELSLDDLRYVTPIADADALQWQPGDIIWFAGRNLVAWASTVEAAGRFSADWVASARGYRLKAGTSASFRRWKERIAGQLSVAFRKAVRDPEQVASRYARAAWNLFRAFEPHPTQRRAINDALYYFEIEQDQERFEAVKRHAVRNGAFVAQEEFDAVFEQTQAFLKQKRLAEMKSGGSGAVIGLKTLRIAQSSQYLKELYGSERGMWTSERSTPPGRLIRGRGFGLVEVQGGKGEYYSKLRNQVSGIVDRHTSHANEAQND